MKIIFHLLTTDWQRFKRPVIVLWVLLALTALPWLLHTPDALPMPQSLGWSYNSDLEINPFEQGRPASSQTILIGSLLVSLLAIILAARLGMQWVKQPVAPIRRRERVPALLLSLVLFIILPLWGVMFLNLVLQEFSAGTAALAAASQAGSALLLLGLVAAFAAWCSTGWQFLAGLAGLFSIGGFIREMLPGYHPGIFGFISNLFLLPAGPSPWLFGALAIALLAVLSPFFHQRFNAAVRIATAVAAVLVAAVTMDRLPETTFTSPKFAQLPPAGISGIRTQIVEPRIQRDDVAAADDEHLRLFAEIKANGCPPGHEVEWQAADDGWISQDGRRIGTKIENAGKNDYLGPEQSAGYFIPTDEAANGRAALAALSTDSRSLPPPQSNTIRLTELGTFAFSQPLLANRDAELQVDLIGTVYRYEPVWDVPLTEESVEKRIDGLTWRICRYPSPSGKLRADVRVTHPAIGFSTDPEKVRWDASPLEGGRFYFRTSSGENIPADDALARVSGPMLGGAGWNRKILGPTDRNGRKPEVSDLRLILLKPVVVGRIHPSASVTFRPWLTGDTSDFAVMFRHSPPASVYRRDWFPQRPDPKTCSREEFARWLRVAAMTFSGSSGSERDLAAFAPRFAGLMAKVGNHESVAPALRLGTPESRRQDVIGQFNSVIRAERLAETVFRRGWLNEAREPILRRFRQGELWDSDAVLALEDPGTYPELISRFISRPERESFEKLRLLPGIEPLLRDAVAKAARETNPALLHGDRSQWRHSTSYGMFLYAAKQGDPAALDVMFSLYQSYGTKGEYEPFRDLGYVLSMPDLQDKRYQALAVWLSNKSAASFRFDPLIRLWQPLP